MAAYDVNRHYTTAHSANRVGHFIVTVISSVIAWNDARQTRKSLATLTDRELDDIGLCRGDIDAVASR